MGKEALVRSGPLGRGQEGDTRQLALKKVTSRSVKPCQVTTSRLAPGQNGRREDLAKIRRDGTLRQDMEEVKVPHDRVLSRKV